jgi:peptidoglycan glycosyltransferase
VWSLPKFLKRRWILISSFLLSSLLLPVFISPKEIPWAVDEQKHFSMTEFRQHVSTQIGAFPKQIKVGSHQYRVDYTVRPTLQQYVANLLGEFRPDYASVAVIDNNSGNILSLYDYSRSRGNLNLDLLLNGEHPSASLFKIITSADLLQNTNVGKDTSFQYVGRSTTLFRSQLKDFFRWKPKTESLATAFAKSNNVIFGRAAVANTNRETLLKMAKNLGFTEDLLEELPLPRSRIYIPNDAFGLAELASGFNTDTTMTSLHGALVASIVANQGILKYPKLIHEIAPEVGEEIFWSPQRKDKKVLDEAVAYDLQEMMEETVHLGTAKKVFRLMPYRFKEDLRIGGKTGSITGGIPYGKRDWFSSFAIPQSKVGNDRGISVCVMIVNEKKWYVKSAYLVRKIIEYYYKD